MSEPMRFEFLSHTADAKFRAYGRNLEEAVANAALAMVSLMWDYEKIESRGKETIELRSRSLEGLLVKFLTEILYLLEVKGFLLGRVEAIEIIQPISVQSEETGAGEYVLKALLVGDNHPERYEMISEVKAATYNEFRLEIGPEGVELEMVVDM
ncbi:MAG: archease [Candidatus Saccharicenans sp.]|nr:archease [Candidatus Saccharicenans sp.]MDI6848870.1 archease [Candidatus Saccharicenans sp.]